MKLNIHAEDVPLEQDLERAFPPSKQKLWDLIRPTGKLRVQVALGWVPGTRPEISIPVATVTEGSLEMMSFPYSLEHVTARFAFGHDDRVNQDRLSILAFQGRHDETVIRTDDSGQSFVLCPSADDPVGEWRVRLGKLIVDDLIPDRTLAPASRRPACATPSSARPAGKRVAKGDGRTPRNAAAG